jgi:ketosteroid isomerase-like protein
VRLSRTSCLIVSFAAISLTPVYGQSRPQSSPDPLFQTIASLDTQLFDAFNRCDVAKFASLLANDLEFYHDNDGLSRGPQSTVDALRKNICGKVTRELVPGTMEVYPIANFGAVEIGVHRFRHPGRDDTEPMGEAKFIHIWHNQGGSWKLTRVISVGHHALPK